MAVSSLYFVYVYFPTEIIIGWVREQHYFVNNVIKFQSSYQPSTQNTVK